MTTGQCWPAIVAVLARTLSGRSLEPVHSYALGILSDHTMVRLVLINDFGIEDDGRIIRRLRTRKTEGLLAFLALHQDRWWSRSEMIEQFWAGEDPAAARRKLRLALHSIRAVVSDCLESRGDLVRIQRISVDLDEVNPMQLGNGWRLMPEHEFDWLDALAAQRQASEQFSAVSKVSEVDESNHTAELAYLLSVDPGNAKLYRQLLEEYEKRDSRVAAGLVAALARLNLGERCPPSLRSYGSAHLRSDLCGRIRELTYLSDQLLGPDEPKFCQLNGLGGIGKTRLAAELSQLAGGEDLQVVRVDLRGQRLAQEAVTGSLCAALGYKPEEIEIANEIPSILLILDNADDLEPGGLSFLETLAAPGSGLRVLVTCQVRRADAGAPMAVGPLSMPTGDSPAQVASSESARLILQHAAKTLSEENAPAIATLARASGGIPLAAQIIGSFCRFSELGFAVESISAKRIHKLRSTVPAGSTRHHSLESTLEWGLDQLSAEIQTSLGRISWVEGTFGSDCYPVVESSDELIFAALESGWLAATENDEWALLPPVRDFLRARFAEFERPVRERMRDFLSSKLRHAYPLDFASVAQLAERYAADILWYIEHDDKADLLTRRGLLIGLSVIAHKYGRGDLLLTQLVSQANAEPDPALTNLVGNTFYLRRDFAEAEKWFTLNLNASDPEVRSVAESNLGLIRLSTGFHAEAVTALRSSIGTTTDPRRRHARKLNLGSALMACGALEESEEQIVAANTYFEDEQGLGGYAALCQLRLAEVRLLADRLGDARTGALLALDDWEQSKQWTHISDAYSVLILTESAARDQMATAHYLERWAQLSPASTEVCTTVFVALHLFHRPDLAEVVAGGISAVEVPLVVSALARKMGIELPSKQRVAHSRSAALALARQALKRL